MNVHAVYTLESVDNERAIIGFKGQVKSDSTTANLQGYDVSSNLSGKEEGEYEMDVTTGMLKKALVDTKVSGSLTMMGRDIPIDINGTVKITRREN